MRKGFKYTLKWHAKEQDSLHALLNVLGEHFESRGCRNTGDTTVCKQVFVNKLILVKATESNTHKLN